MLTIIFRKMLNTRWMVLCLFLGFLMAAGMMSTVPIYMDASLQRMLVKDMEQFQLDSGEYPGKYIVTKTYREGVPATELAQVLEDLPDRVAGEVLRIGIPADTFKTTASDNLLYLDRGGAGSSSSTRVKIVGMSGVEQHVTMTEGELFSDSGITDDGCYEVIVSESALRNLGIVCGNTYDVRSINTAKDKLRIKVVGVFTQADLNDTYWSEELTDYAGAVFMKFDAYCAQVAKGGTLSMGEISVSYNLDYHQVNMNDIGGITGSITEDFSAFSSDGYTLEMPSLSILSNYVQRAADLTKILWAIQIPTMVMLAFYLFMVSQLNTERERNEIAVLKSRGASPKQIFGIYAAEMGLLGVATLVIAPFIGLTLSQFLGVSNGFLEFVNRTGIAAKITLTGVIYALIAVVIFFLTTMLPIIPASRLTIVQYKQSRTKVAKTSLWEICGLDILLILLSGVFYYLYTHNISNQIANGTFEATGQVDPLLFLFATCAVIGLGLLFVRLYPYLLRLIYIIGKPLWTPAQYMALSTVSCSGGSKERFLMLFLVITFASGLFSANTARAINNNKEDRIYYQNGADVTMQEYWMENSATVDGQTVTTYEERSFSRYEQLAGVESAAKVLRNDSAKIRIANNTLDGATMMAVEPEEFAKTAWFRNDLLPVHWYNYCNALTNYSSGVLLSASAAEQYNVELGDEIQVRWLGNDFLKVTVLAIIDYWPGINPNLQVDGGAKPFCVLNYNYVYNQTELTPYEVWLNLSNNATSEALYESIEESSIPLEWIKDSSQQLIEEKNQPALQGMNGGLTLGFIIIMIMAIIGFLIYWILSIKGRTLQFGILRAMGVTGREIITMLGYEQLLVSGASIAVAFVIGGVVSDFIVPLFQSMYDVTQQIPPFIVSASQGDYVKIYVLIAVMLIGGFIILGNIIRKININKALKLGED